MKKYYIGLIVIALVTAGLLVYVIGLASASKQDRKTYESATEIANKLNDYIANRRTIPESLSSAGINDVPDTVKYEKLSAAKYKFCVNYKADRGYGGIGMETVLTGALYGSSYAGFEDGYPYNDSYEPSTLYVDYYYKKGENCQTIRPYLPSSSYLEYDNDGDIELNFNGSGSELELYQGFYSEYCTPTIPEGYETYCQSLREQLQ